MTIEILDIAGNVILTSSSEGQFEHYIISNIDQRIRLKMSFRLRNRDPTNGPRICVATD